MDTKHKIAKRAAQFLHPGDVVNLGIGTPSLCIFYAEPGVIFQTENGLVGYGAKSGDTEIGPPESFCDTVANSVYPLPGGASTDTALAMGIIRGGHLTSTVLGGMQVSVHGDLANWSAPGHNYGMGGAMDLCNGSCDVIVAMEHCTKDGSPKIVNECTLPVTGRHCVKHIVTELCVIDVTSDGLVLREIAPGHTLAEVLKKTEAPLLYKTSVKNPA